MVKIEKWESIKDQFTDSLLLGNGASIAIDKCFSYSSLYEAANLGKEVESIFQGFETQNFELVLQKLNNAKTVTEALDIECPQIPNAHKKVQDALKRVLLQKHTSHKNFSNHKEPIAKFLKHFKKT